MNPPAFLEGSHCNQTCAYLGKYCQESRVSTGKEMSGFALLSQISISIFNFLFMISEHTCQLQLAYLMNVCRSFNNVMLGITKATFAATDVTGLQCQNYLGRDVCKVPFTLYVGLFRNGF